MTENIQAIKTDNLKMCDTVDQHHTKQTVYEDQQEEFHKAGRFIQRIGPGVSPEIQEFYHGFLFLHEGCKRRYGAEHWGYTNTGTEINRTAGMKLIKRIGNPALTAADYKNTAFLRVMVPYLDGISVLAVKFGYFLLHYPTID